MYKVASGLPGDLMRRVRGALRASLQRVLMSGVLVPGLAGVLGSLPVADPAGAKELRPISGSHTLSADGRVRVETVSGSVRVQNGEPGEVSVTGAISEGLKFEISGSNDDVLVRVKWPERHRWRSHDDECRLEIRMPATASVKAEAVSASVDVSGIDGEVEVQTVSGEIEVRGDPERLAAESVSGGITCDVGSGRVRCEAVSGDVRARTGGGEIEATTVSGRVDVQGETFESVQVESVSGDIDITGALAREGRVDISAHSGDVGLSLRGEISAMFDVSSFSGSIESELGGEAERAHRYGPGSEYEQSVGEGTARVDIEAFSGRVRLRRM
jgi:hypothetical protein